MSKAILILDQIPSGCERCPILDRDKDGKLCAVKMQVVESKFNWDRPEWCPIKPLPEPMFLEGGDYMEYNEGCMDGWNNLLNEISGEK